MSIDGKIAGGMLSYQSAETDLAGTMDGDAEVEIIRKAYARQVLAAAGVVDRRLEAAFAAVPREAFLGRGPWQIVRWGRGYVPTPSADPVYLYTDDVVAIRPERNLNNGQPSLHALLIAAAAPKPGEHIVHIGAGVGYYTAILHRLAGRQGRVTAIEYDGGLIERLRANLAAARHLEIVHGDGSQADFDQADVIYVNAGATRPADLWLDRLAEGGRLILPLTATSFADGNIRRGAVFAITRRGPDYAARRLSAVAIFPCEGMRDPVSEAALAAAFDRGGAEKVTRLYRSENAPAGDCWVRAPGWSLA